MEHQINEEIREKEVRLIDSEGQQLGIMSLQKALDALNQKNLDSQSTFMADNQADARQMYQDKPELMENNGW